MPTEYLPPEDEFDYATDWKEAIDSTQPGGGDHVSAKEQEAVLVGYVPFNKVQSAEKWFLGHSSCDTNAPYRLHRVPPTCHPRRPHLCAFSFSSVGIGPKSHLLPAEPEDPEDPEGEPDQPAAPAGWTRVESVWPGPDDETLYFADYEYALCTVRFKSFGRIYLAADFIMPTSGPWYPVEWKRYTEITIGPQTQALQADGSSNLMYLEGSPAGAPPYGGSFPAPVAELMAKCTVRVRWLNVPHEYLSDNVYYLNPTKIIGCLGKVSSAPHLGFPAGTMLLLGAEFEPTLMPVTADLIDDPFTGWDVTLSYEQFDPPKGVPDTPPGTSPYRGHRLFPWRKDGKWYFATRENGTSELLPLTNLDRVFQHVADPT